MKKLGVLFPFFCVLVLLAGCQRGQRALPIDLPVCAIGEVVQEAALDPLFEPSLEWIPDAWWTLFNDEQLEQYILKAFACNPTLHSAQAKIAMAVANAERARATLFPSLTWLGDVGRQKLSETGVVPFGNTSIPVNLANGFIPEYFTLYETSLNLQFDFDIWGKNRSTLRAVLSEVQANRADAAFSRLQLGIAVASVYFQLQVDYKREKIWKEIVDAKASLSALTDLRVEDNVDSLVTYHQTQANVEAAKQTLLQIQADIVVNEDQLRAYLAGNFEECICPIDIDTWFLPVVPLPCEVPLNLLARRPDITAQLWMIESAGRQIDAARAGFYPNINLTAFFGFQTIHFRELFKWPSTYFNVDPAFSLPIFDGGRLLANLHGSQVNYDTAIFDYNQLVLDAAREVLDAIAILRNQKLQLDTWNQQWQQLENILHLSDLRLNNGLDSNLDYLAHKQNMLSAYDQEIVALGSTLQAVLSLIKALGGGYNPCCPIE